MTATSIPGSSCTFKIGATVYSAQVTGYDISGDSDLAPIKTLSDKAYPKNDDNDTLNLSYLYDDESGLAGALWTAYKAGTSLSIEAQLGDSKYTGTMYVTAAGSGVTAEGATTGTAAFIGDLTLADVA
jgi:hypothetical protein